jgi:putative nucleotidyltransferase with HDIG domain
MRGAGADQRILFIVDEPGQARNDALIAALGAARTTIADVTADSIAEHRLIAIDADLTKIPNVKKIRGLLRGRRDGYFHAFAVDTSRRLETVHANVVGATALLHRPFEVHELMARVADFQRSRLARPAGAGDSASIGSAALALGDLFEALTSGHAVQVSTVVAAGAEIVDDIDGLGFPSWVDDVRRHHEGTFQHCLIVTGLASAFGRSTGMGRKDAITLTTAGLLHDIGKAAVPVEILDKPGRLTPAEMEVVRSHPGRGWDHLRTQSGIDRDVLAAVRGHHEFLDGSGYPDRLRAPDIGDVTRILTICDVYGALIERRSYKEPHAPEAALAVLDEMATSGKLEPPLVRAFHHTVLD